MNYLVGVIAFLVVVVLVPHLLGSRMPREHHVSRTRRIRAPATAVFRAITDVDGLPQWRGELRSVEKLEPVSGRRRFRENSGHGKMTFEVTEEVPDHRLVTTIIDEGQPFGGRWTTELTPMGEETEVTITEDGFVNPPVFRFLSKHVFGHSTTMDTYLSNLEKRFAQVTG